MFRGLEGISFPANHRHCSHKRCLPPPGALHLLDPIHGIIQPSRIILTACTLATSSEILSNPVLFPETHRSFSMTTPALKGDTAFQARSLVRQPPFFRSITPLPSLTADTPHSSARSCANPPNSPPTTFENTLDEEQEMPFGNIILRATSENARS